MTAASHEVRGMIVNATRGTNTKSGNPRWRVLVDTGMGIMHAYLTVPDAQVNHRIDELRRQRGQWTFHLDGYNRIINITHTNGALP